MSSATLQHDLAIYGYVAVFLFVALEYTGIPLPGETMLIAAGVYAGTGHLNILLVIIFAALAAILGATLGYILGRTVGRIIVVRYGRYIRFDARKLELAERFFRRHGVLTVFLGRFVAVLRTWAAFLAGVHHMPWLRFMAVNFAGGLVWAALFGYLAYTVGERIPLGRIGMGGVVVLVLVVAGLFALHRSGFSLDRVLLGDE